VCVTLNHRTCYPPDSFKCVDCGTKFGTGPYYVKDDKSYCKEDYEKHFAEKCHACKLPITGKKKRRRSADSVTTDEITHALDLSFHAACLKCTDCSTVLGADFFTKDGKGYCGACFLPKCSTCEKEISTDFVEALGMSFHRECFRCFVRCRPCEPDFFNFFWVGGCQECKEPFTNGAYFEDGGHAFCSKDFSVRKDYGVCFACSEHILGHYIEVDNKKFHQDHFRCHFCEKDLMSSNVETTSQIRQREGKFACDACAVPVQ